MLAKHWRIVICSVRGASHIHQNLPNQDAVLACEPLTHQPLQVFMAVADGHGSQRYFRSNKGSQLAVREAIEGLHEWYKQCTEQSTEQTDFSRIKREALDYVPKLLVRRWQKAVKEHLSVCPLSLEEQEILGEFPSETAYGTTLLATLLTEQHLIYWQLGDGDILQIHSDGSITRPFSSDERLLANETFSLCQVNAWQEFRCSFQRLETHVPMLILLATDGYANSYAQEADFKKVARDLWQWSQDKGVDYVQKHLSEWLKQTSEQGSGDDITVGLIIQETRKESE